MGMFKGRKKGSSNPDKKSPELHWNSTSYVPRPNTEIVFDSLGTRFTGTFVKQIAPWGGVWYIDMRYFSPFKSVRSVRTNQIERWAYVDGSKPHSSALYA